MPDNTTEFAQHITAWLRRLAGELPPALRASVDGLIQRPGKRLRSSLVAGCASYGDPDPDRLYRAGALVELVHIASLLHDDVVDDTNLRRGVPTAHTVVGPELALLSGLACFALAGKEAADLGHGASKAVGTTVANLSYGQMLDVERAFDTELTVENYLELVLRKTADLLRLCCVLGAVEAHLSSALVAGLATFGTEVGIAFQILDDCLDIESVESGKEKGTDQLLGLFGAPTLFALHADHSGDLRQMLLSPNLAVDDLPAVHARVRRLGGLELARRLADEHYRSALDALDALPNQRGRSNVLRAVEPMWANQG